MSDRIRSQNHQKLRDRFSGPRKKEGFPAAAAATAAATQQETRRRYYGAGHSAGCGHALAAAAFFSGQIGQSMHLAMPIPICHCPPGPGAVPLSAGTERPRRRGIRWENPNFDSTRV